MDELLPSGDNHAGFYYDTGQSDAWNGADDDGGEKEADSWETLWRSHLLLFVILIKYLGLEIILDSTVAATLTLYGPVKEMME